MALLIQQVASQRTWPEAGDIDDCWVLSAIEMVRAVAPWEPPHSVFTFRKNAGDPDDGVRDGGNVDEIMKGISGTYPRIAPLCKVRKGATKAQFEADLRAGRVLSVCLDSSKLPARLKYNFNGLHQVTMFWETPTMLRSKPRSGLRVANPLQPDRAWPDAATIDEVWPSLASYGNGTAYYVASPTVPEAFKAHPLYRDPAAATEVQIKSAVDAAIKSLKTANLGQADRLQYLVNEAAKVIAGLRS